MAKRKLEGPEDFERALRNGFGLGQGSNYIPWLRVQDISSTGRSTKLPGILVDRQHHLLSDHEKRLFLLEEFNVENIDIREQFPLLPLSLAMRIAEQAGIKYPIHQKTKKPIIESTDFLLTRKTSEGIKHIAVAVKTSDELMKVRVLEKLEIERIWWTLLGVEWRLATEEQLNRTVCNNLDWFSDPLRGRKRDEINAYLQGRILNQIQDALTPGRVKYEKLIEIARRITGCSSSVGSKLVRVMMWRRLIDVDLYIPIQKEQIVDITRINAIDLREVNNGIAS
ncbi:MAG: heteromeric transposase endonuclease subunit TnsA [gamma proteobacterium symbiont of Ctena orbiculata]|nr:MAG: heteromeric transposase endonuclease subunit TnsA [gamma proteobacterium symbiont of Ctena orbiculata]